MRNHRILSFLGNFYQNISSNARLNAIRILRIGNELGLNPKVIDNLEEGGVFVDFIRNSHYFAFEFHNDGEIIFIRKNSNGQSTVNELEVANLNQDLFN